MLKYCCISRDSDLMSDTKIYDSKDYKNEYVSNVVKEVANILEDRGYNPINQIVGYLMSGDPGYISSHKDARNKISSIERSTIIEVLLRNYISKL